MTADEFKTWRKGLDLTQQEAADAIGITKRSVQLYEAGTQPVSRTIALACAAIAAGLKPLGEVE
ncbi:helix-turn-helix domain-containing protein [Azospirillum brasilense]|uniref:helix-turn-helix domain-containing protein n=1 Tax=Azospirillum brasilense TaxID=192 RepID=UPI000E69B145|nr:helix-turn-helix transcriptional regulator [Azospirillum brasilense]NUB29744.1 helix-turn-helix domain-containing protein [Azospirillum brasilense]NUB34220.1 helix-turn-helix domain-containing protein [Azospirillum brasilense]RIV99251.1 XRE family transcriptional regulator [Azospirillum brasilense]